MEGQRLSRVELDPKSQVEGGRKKGGGVILSRLTQHKAVSVVYIERVQRSERRCLSVRASQQHQRRKHGQLLPSGSGDFCLSVPGYLSSL